MQSLFQYQWLYHELLWYLLCCHILQSVHADSPLWHLKTRTFKQNFRPLPFVYWKTKRNFPIKVYVFELAYLSAFQRCKNEIHTMFVSKADFFHLRFFSLLLRFWRPNLMQYIVLLNIFPTIPNLLRLKNSLESYRQKKKDCTLVLNRL